jgi:hypothetical protein
LLQPSKSKRFAGEVKPQGFMEFTIVPIPSFFGMEGKAVKLRVMSSDII